MNLGTPNIEQLYNDLKSNNMRVTPESFVADYNIWESSINDLASFDAHEVHNMLDNIDVDELPLLDDLTDADIYEVYRNQHKVKKQLMMWRALIEPHVSFNETAMKLLKDLAGSLFEGTVKDKEAQASNVVKHFTMRAMVAKALLKRVDTHIQLLDFSSQQVTRAMRDSQQAERLSSLGADRARSRDLTAQTQEQEDMYPVDPNEVPGHVFDEVPGQLNTWSSKENVPF